jgi:hypothetical protein
VEDIEPDSIVEEREPVSIVEEREPDSVIEEVKMLDALPMTHPAQRELIQTDPEWNAQVRDLVFELDQYGEIKSKRL